MWNRQIKINEANICNVGVILLQLSNIVFALSWLAGICSIIYFIVLCIGTAYTCIVIKDKMTGCLTISVRALIVLVLGTSCFIWVCGIGGYFPQGSDWFMRNAIYRDLLNYDWPVIYSETGYGLCYYIGFWLPPACAAKVVQSVFGCGEWTVWNIGNFMLYLWSFLCLLCVFLLLMTKAYKNNMVGIKSVMLLFTVFACWGG